MARKKEISISGNMPLPGRNTPGTVIITAPRLFMKDMADYMQAVRGANNVDFTQRTRLYDLYEDILIDGHTGSVIEKRKSAVQCSQIEFRRNGVPDEGINTLLRSPWFYRFIGDLIDSDFWGFSLFQFYKDGSGWMDYRLVPRKNYDPVRGLIKHRQEDTTGEPLENYHTMLFVGERRSLGRLARIAPYVIYKRNDMADWAQFCEIFGMPIREYTYSAGDEQARDQAVKDMAEQGGAAVFLHPEEAQMKLIESGNKSGSSDLYRTLYDTCNDEISKIVLGNTLTTQASERGTQALGTVQEKGEKKLNEADRILVLNTLNYDMTDIFTAFGYDTRGGEFYYVKPKETTAEQEINIISRMRQMGTPVSDEYVYEATGIPKPENYGRLKQEAGTSDRDKDDVPGGTSPVPAGKKDRKKEDGIVNRIRSFFVAAPRKGALKW